MISVEESVKEGGKKIAELKKEIALRPTEELVRMQAHITELLRRKKNSLPAHVPVSIFSKELSPAEAVVKYLKENRGLALCEIAKAINRDQRGIWGAYSRSRRKMPESFRIETESHTIPLSCFNDRSRSILEHVVTHLKDEKKMKVRHICALLKKHPSTIWTAYQRSRRKQNA